MGRVTAATAVILQLVEQATDQPARHIIGAVLTSDVDDAAVGKVANSAVRTNHSTEGALLRLTETELNANTLELGGIISGPEKVDDAYDRIDASGNIYQDTIEDEDALGFRARRHARVISHLIK